MILVIYYGLAILGILNLALSWFGNHDRMILK
jgi:hypothetical protein